MQERARQGAQTGAGRETAPRLALRGLTKGFPGVLACDGVSLEVRPGEIHALLGENGAGKSTLVGLIYGLLQPDAGEIRWNGEAVRPRSPGEARALGIAMVFQHFSLFEAMSVRENVALGLDERLSRRALDARLARVMADYGLALDADATVAELGVGERQRIEIVRALMTDPRLLILDEPTSVLTPQETEALFVTLRRLAAAGRSILYISHKLAEIRALCDRATVLRGGRVVATCDPRAETAASLAETMIGQRPPAVARPARGHGETVLETAGLDLEGAGRTGLRDVALRVAGGEILGIAGVAGNGQDALMAALSGERTVAPDMVRLAGRAVGHLGIGARRRRGLAAVPEERRGHAAVPDFSLTDNAVLTARHGGAFGRWLGGLRRAAARGHARGVIGRFGVRAPGPETLAGALSGGNLQKYVVGREMARAPSVLAVAQPTWGVDAGAAAAIHQALVDLAAEGAGIVVISQDLDELLALSDRIAVLAGGRLSAPMAAAAATPERLGLLMGGEREAEAADA